MTTRIMSGLENLEGRQFGTLRAIRMVKRQPEPVYATRCEQCSAESTATHSRLRNGAAVCRNSACGKQSLSNRRDLLREQRRIATEREAEAERAATEAAAARMNADTQDYERPERYAPKPSEPDNLTDRQRRSLREFREAEEAERRAADAPRLEAERKQQERIEQLQTEQQDTLRQLHSLERERVANGKDDAFEIDPATCGEGNSIPADRVQAWQAAQFTEFLGDNPGYFKCDENGQAISAYLERNAPCLRLISAHQLTAAYRRLRDFGLLKQRPEPTPEPKAAPTPSRVNLRISHEPKPTPQDDGSETGIDWTTGQPLTLTRRQVNALSADDYRRFKKLDKSALELPNVGPSVRHYAETEA